MEPGAVHSVGADKSGDDEKVIGFVFVQGPGVFPEYLV